MLKIGFYVIVLYLSVFIIMWLCFDFQELNFLVVKKDKRSYGLMNGLKKEFNGIVVKFYYDDFDVVRVILIDGDIC